MAPDRTIGPSCVLSFRGIELDSMLLEASLPRDKISKCILLVPSSQKGNVKKAPILQWALKFCMLCDCSWSSLPSSPH